MFARVKQRLKQLSSFCFEKYRVKIVSTTNLLSSVKVNFPGILKQLIERVSWSVATSWKQRKRTKKKGGEGTKRKGRKNKGTKRKRTKRTKRKGWKGKKRTKRKRKKPKNCDNWRRKKRTHSQSRCRRRTQGTTLWRNRN